MPLLKRLTEKGYVERRRSAKDERDLIVTLTDLGEALKEKAVTVPEWLSVCVGMGPQKAQALYAPLYEVLGRLAQCDSSKENQRRNLNTLPNPADNREGTI